MITVKWRQRKTKKGDVESKDTMTNLPQGWEVVYEGHETFKGQK